MIGLKKYVQIHPRFVAFIFLKNPGNNGAGKLGLSYTKVKVFVGSPLLLGFLEAGLSVTVDFPLPITSM